MAEELCRALYHKIRDDGISELTSGKLLSPKKMTRKDREPVGCGRACESRVSFVSKSQGLMIGREFAAEPD